MTSAVPGGAPAPADPLAAEERIRWVLDRVPDSDAVTVAKDDVRAVLGLLDAARADVERLAAKIDAALAAVDGWESDSSAFSTVPGFRRYVVDGIREALGATDG